MATIRASCPDCGDVEFTSDDVHVRVSDDDGSGTYAFHCPSCRVTVVKAAEARTIDLLVASGVMVVNGEPPAEMAEHPAGGDAITHDDLLEFHELLHRDESWFTRLTADLDEG